jgi:DNA-binding MarR family transcriptional regulator
LSAARKSRQSRSINYWVHALASSLFKGAQHYYGKRFGVGIPEMRILSNLASDGSLTATQLVGLTAMDKGLVSRILSGLHARGLVGAITASSDPRRRTWSLSRRGEQMVETLRPMWETREGILQVDLSNAERAQLVDMLGRLFHASEELRRKEAKELREMRKPKIRVPRSSPGAKAESRQSKQ